MTVNFDNIGSKLRERTVTQNDMKYETLEEAVEAQDIHIDTWAEENEPSQFTKIKLVDTGTKEESDVDVALNLEAESQRGK